MAEPKIQNTSGLSAATDLSKFPVYDVPDTDREGYIKSTEDTLKALEDRYANPNYFKVAAGFLKPQLGGFFASLGSASEALGENVEQQRAMGLPIAEVRAKLAQQKALLGQNVDVSAQIKQWHIDHPNEVPSPGMVAHWAAKSPDSPAVKGLLGQQDLSLKQQQLLRDQQQTKLQVLEKARASALISEADYNKQVGDLLGNLSGIPRSPNVPTTTETTTSGGTSETTQETTPQTGQTKPVTDKVEAAPSTTKFKLVPSYSSADLHPQEVTAAEKANNASILAKAALLEKDKEVEYQNMQNVNRNAGFSTAYDANRSAIDMLDKDKESAAEVAQLLRNKGPLAELLAGGLGIHFGAYGATVNLAGLKPALVANLPKEKRDYYDKLLNNLSKSVYYDLLSRGIDPEKEGAVKFGQRMLQEASLDQGVDAIHRALVHNQARLEYNRDAYKFLSKEMPKYKKETFTPLHDLDAQHPEMRILKGVLQRKLEAAQ